MLITQKEYIGKFEKLLSVANISEVEFNTIIKELVFQTPQNAEQRDIPFVIRTSLLDKNEKCKNISRCSYVPDFLKEKIPLQRCNFKEQQVFYASIASGMKNFSDGAQPSLIETTMQRIIDDPKFDARIAAASRWRFVDQPIFWHLSHFENSVKQNENFSFLFNQFDNHLKNHCTSNDEYQNFTEKLNYLSELFCRDYDREKVYKITASFHNMVIKSFRPFGKMYDAFIYPSAYTNGEGMNIALSKEFVYHKKIYCDLVVLYKINRNPADTMNIWFAPFAQSKPDELGNLNFFSIDIPIVE